MGLIKSGIKYGALAYVAKQAINVVNDHGHQQQGQQGQQQQPFGGFLQGGSSRDGQYLQYQNEGSGYVHQSYCNGSCGQQCNPGYNGHGYQQQQQQQQQQQLQLPMYRGGSEQQMSRGQLMDSAPPAYIQKAQTWGKEMM